MDYIIGTGWWCDGSGVHAHSKHQKQVDRNTRRKDFFNLWYKSVKKYTNPRKIIMVDSNSPIKPDLKGKNDVQMYSLSKNWGAGLVGTTNGHLSGWDRGILMAASMAFFDNADYFVYVEQDCLLKGQGIIEHAISSFKKDKWIMLGNGKGTPQPTQQSLIIIKRDYIPRFIREEMQAEIRDIKINGKQLIKQDAEMRYKMHYNKDIQFLPFDGGRLRPIRWDAKHTYAQHLRTVELERFKKVIKG